MRIYMDVCCLNRPFDDLSQVKVYLEAEAVLAILSRCEHDDWTLLTSSVIDYELSKMTDLERLEQVTALCLVSDEHVFMSYEDENRAADFQQSGIKPIDSFHLAVAEANNIDAFLTTDKQLINAGSRLNLKLKIANPVSWFMEVVNNE